MEIGHTLTRNKVRHSQRRVQGKEPGKKVWICPPSFQYFLDHFFWFVPPLKLFVYQLLIASSRRMVTMFSVVFVYRLIFFTQISKSTPLFFSPIDCESQCEFSSGNEIVLFLFQCGPGLHTTFDVWRAAAGCPRYPPIPLLWCSSLLGICDPLVSPPTFLQPLRQGHGF